MYTAFLVGYFLTSITVVEIMCWLVDKVYGVKANLFHRIIIFVVWPLIILYAMFMSLVGKK